MPASCLDCGSNWSFKDGSDPTPASSRFHHSDVSAWKKHLEEEGYVTISGLFTDEELNHDAPRNQTSALHNMLWKRIEESSNWRRDQPNDWNGESTGNAHSQLSWTVRERVGDVFRHAWGTDDVMTSFDGVSLWAPFHMSGKEHRKPGTLGLHMDAGHHQTRQLDTIQGMFTLLEHNPATVGGLRLVSRSHLAAKEMCDKGHFMSPESSYNPVKSEENSKKYVWDTRQGRYMRWHGQPGDFILWDSRTLHGTSPPVESRDSRCKVEQSARAAHEKPVAGTDSNSLARVIVYVAMEPTEKVKRHTDGLRKNNFHQATSDRKHFVDKRQQTTHAVSATFENDGRHHRLGGSGGPQFSTFDQMGMEMKRLIVGNQRAGWAPASTIVGQTATTNASAPQTATAVPSGEIMESPMANIGGMSEEQQFQQALALSKLEAYPHMSLFSRLALFPWYIYNTAKHRKSSGENERDNAPAKRKRM